MLLFFLVCSLPQRQGLIHIGDRRVLLGGPATQHKPSPCQCRTVPHNSQLWYEQTSKMHPPFSRPPYQPKKKIKENKTKLAIFFFCKRNVFIRFKQYVLDFCNVHQRFPLVLQEPQIRAHLSVTGFFQQFCCIRLGRRKPRCDHQKRRVHRENSSTFKQESL